MGTSLEQIRIGLPGLLRWLPRVFWVLGGYIGSTGLLTCCLARTSFRAKAAGAWQVVVVTGLTSIGSMAGVNFVNDSDFKWLLLLFTTPWILSLALLPREIQTLVGNCVKPNDLLSGLCASRRHAIQPTAGKVSSS